jgi:hypothetical protein
MPPEPKQSLSRLTTGMAELSVPAPAGRVEAAGPGKRDDDASHDFDAKDAK